MLNGHFGGIAMDSFEEFLSTHPLTVDQVEAMYTFLHDLRNLEAYTNITMGGLMDILVQFYE